MKKSILTLASVTILTLAAVAFGPISETVPPPPAITLVATTQDTNTTAINFYSSTAASTNNTLIGTAPTFWTNGVYEAVLPNVQPQWATSYQFLAKGTNTLTGASSLFSIPGYFIEPNAPIYFSLAAPATVTVSAVAPGVVK